MRYSKALSNDADAIAHLFIKTFSDSEGKAEGEMIGRLARGLMSGTPEGWLAQSLKGDGVQPIKGKSSCVEALNRPEYW